MKDTEMRVRTKLTLFALAGLTVLCVAAIVTTQTARKARKHVEPVVKMQTRNPQAQRAALPPAVKKALPANLKAANKKARQQSRSAWSDPETSKQQPQKMPNPFPGATQTHNQNTAQ